MRPNGFPRPRLALLCCWYDSDYTQLDESSGGRIVRRSKGQIPTGPSTEKIAVSLPRSIAEALKRQVHSGAAPSVSAFVSAAVQDKLEKDELQEVLDEIFTGRPMTDEDRAWADRFFFDEPDEPGA